MGHLQNLILYFCGQMKTIRNWSVIRILLCLVILIGHMNLAISCTASVRNPVKEHKSICQNFLLQSFNITFFIEKARNTKNILLLVLWILLIGHVPLKKHIILSLNFLSILHEKVWTLFSASAPYLLNKVLLI